MGPTADGGYYLIGARGAAEGIFDEIPWSTDAVARVTLERAGALGLTVHQLPPWYDVDDVDSLRRALAENQELVPGLIRRFEAPAGTRS
jgi:glycosyltransferase A (GT-A) superfamily protein (DUF2064 family)